MRFEERTPAYGDMIRVKVKFYYHYGVFLDENRVVQFGLPDNTGIPPEQIAVIMTDCQTFLQGGTVETACLTFWEKRRRRPPAKTEAYALSRLGQTGYHILHNNCEHFAYDCVMGKPFCELEQQALTALKQEKSKK